MRHRGVRMLVIDRISGLSAAPCAARNLSMAFRWNDFGLVHRPPVSYLLAMQSLLASRRPGVSQATTPRSGLVQPRSRADYCLAWARRGRSPRALGRRATTFRMNIPERRVIAVVGLRRYRMRKDIEFQATDGTILRGWHYLPDTTGANIRPSS